MKKLIAGLFMVAALVFAVANDYHAHTPHSCPKHPEKAHKCHRVAGSFQDPDGVEGCICIFDCFGTPFQLKWSNVKLWLAS